MPSTLRLARQTLLLSERGAWIGRPVCVKAARAMGSALPMTPDPRPPSPAPTRGLRFRPRTRCRCRRTRTRVPSEWIRSSAPRPSRPTTPRSRRSYGALLSRDRGTARAGARRSRRRSSPRIAAASFALSKLVVHEKVESWVRRPFVDERSRRPKGRRLALRGRRVADVHALHRRMERARARRAADPLARRGADGRRGARRLGRKRPAAGGLSIPVRTRHAREKHRAEDPALRPRVERVGLMARRSGMTCHASNGTNPDLRHG